MDFVDCLPPSHGYTCIMVVVDRFSKYSHFLALKHSFTALSVAKLFMQQVYRLHGLPTSIVSDRDKIFLSNLSSMARTVSLSWCTIEDELRISSAN